MPRLDRVSLMSGHKQGVMAGLVPAIHVRRRLRRERSPSTTTGRASLPPELLDLVDYRVSQINGCAFCLDMHSKDLRARSETEQRIYMVSAWRDAPHLYSDRERAALAWLKR